MAVSSDVRFYSIRKRKKNFHFINKTILRAFDKISPAIQLENPENQFRVDYILNKTQKLDFDFPAVFFEHAAILWKDAGVQECFANSDKYQLIDCAK